MPRKLRKSFVGHPSAILFLPFSLAGVFQHPRDILPIDKLLQQSGVITLTDIFSNLRKMSS